MRTFELSDAEEAKFEEWRLEKKKTKKLTTTGGSYTFQFTPTSIGTVIEVLCSDGTKLDLTDYNQW
jgi:hypothetical protein